MLALAEVRVVVAEDQEQVDKLIRLKDALPKLDHDRVLRPARAGRLPAAVPGAVRRRRGRRRARTRGPARRGSTTASPRDRPDDTAVICTTSGTTARPKLAELSHANLLAMAEHLTEIDPLRPGLPVRLVPAAGVDR